MLQTKIVQIGAIAIGGHHPIAIQSMTNTKTKDVEATVAQIHALEKAGCDIVRVAVLDEEDAHAIKRIKERINIPIVADIHFDYRLALTAIDSGVDKLRINPGNIGSIDRIKQIVEKCKEKNIPIRIGVNLGSLQQDILAEYGRTPKALVASAMRHVQILESLDFYNIVLSLKASDVQTTIAAYLEASQVFPYPLHIGVTEAGTAFGGTIKSAIGLGVLLHQGIGNTLRVSLAADPVEEIEVAKEILATFGLYDLPNIIACPTCGRTDYNMLHVTKEIEEFLKTIPRVKLSVAIMGCIVNGPGEAKDADIGIAGGNQEAILFRKGTIVRKIKQDEMAKVLKEEIVSFVEEQQKK